MYSVQARIVCLGPHMDYFSPTAYQPSTPSIIILNEYYRVQFEKCVKVDIEESWNVLFGRWPIFFVSVQEHFDDHNVIRTEITALVVF